MSLPRSATLLAGVLIAWAPTTAWSQDLSELEQNLQKLAEQSIPKTVLVKAIVGPGREGAGSGAIISPDGYILTCTHVVEIGKTIEVYTADGTKYEAKVLGRNKRQDYALLKIDGKNLPTFAIGDSSTVKKGDWVVALGHPGGPYKDLQPAFAAGRVIDLDRKLPVGMMSKYYNHAIMTDVPIFAGDSGGPLVNDKGELVGINGAIVMINELAFAVPLNQIMKEMDDLKAGKLIEGEPAGPEAMAEMQKLISPEDYQKMTSKMMKNFGKMFGGENGENPLAKLFGGENGENPLAKLFGGENGEMPDLSKLFGGQGGEAPDFSKLFGEDSPFGKMFGGENGEAPDFSKLFGEDSPFGKMFGGENGEAPDFSKLFGEDGPFGKMFGGGNGENPFGKMFGGGNGENPAVPAPAQTKRAFMGIRIDPASETVPGIVIQEVLADGPAASAGLKKADVIVAINGEKTLDMASLRRVMGSKKAGQKITLKVKRTVFLDTVLVEKQLELRLTLGSR